MAIIVLPPVLETTMSVNVPPTSMPMAKLMRRPMKGCIAIPPVPAKAP